MSPHTPSANSAPYKILKLITGEPATTTIDFVLPNQRFEHIRAGRYWLSSRTSVTPIRRDLCRLDFVAAWNILPWFPIVSFIIHVLGPRFIRQDTEVIEKQALGLKYEDRMMLVDDADRQARWYFELKAAHLSNRCAPASLHASPCFRASSRCVGGRRARHATGIEEPKSIQAQMNPDGGRFTPIASRSGART